MLVYVGDSKRLRTRIRQHCKGNVESSALRKTIAMKMGFDIIKKKRPSGSNKLSIDSDAERIVSNYIQTGKWKVVICSSVEEARDFQWYAIDKTRPPLNKYMQFWKTNSQNRYANLFDTLLDSAPVDFDYTLEVSVECGVYSLWHEIEPEQFVTQT